MCRRKSDTVEIKTDMKLKINGMTVDTRDILAFIAMNKNIMPDKGKLPMVVRKYRALIWMQQQIDDYIQRVKDAIDAVTPPEWPSEDIIDADLKKSLIQDDGICVKDFSAKLKLDADNLLDYKSQISKPLKCAKSQYVKSPYYIGNCN